MFTNLLLSDNKVVCLMWGMNIKVAFILILYFVTCLSKLF